MILVEQNQKYLIYPFCQSCCSRRWKLQDRSLYPPHLPQPQPDFLRQRYHIRRAAAPFQCPLKSFKSGNCLVLADNLTRCDRRGLMRPLPLQASVLIPLRWNTQRLGHWPTDRQADWPRRRAVMTTTRKQGGRRDGGRRRCKREGGRDSVAAVRFFFLSLSLSVSID